MTRPITITEAARAHNTPAHVWRLLGDFGNEDRWSSQLASCRRDTAAVGVGTRRTCVLATPLMGRTETTEELTEYVAGASLAYQLSGRAGPFRVSEGRWVIAPDDDVTVITVSGRFEPLNATVGLLVGPLAKMVAARAARRALADLVAAVDAPDVSQV
jgi:Polyketide cyclase / dehydrase and lipid transport